MKQLFFLVSLLSLASFSISCKTKKDTAASTETTNTITEDKAIKYRVIVSFISKGSGVNAPLYNSITNYIDNHPKKPISKKVLWGREGENDLCFSLSELSRSEQNAFISEIKKIVGTSDMVSVTENAKCIHQGR